MPSPRLSLPLFALLAALVAPGREALAHGLDAGRATLELEEEVVRVVVTPRSRAFAWADDSGDGLLSLAEVGAHRTQIREAVDAAFVVTDQAGQRPLCTMTDVSTPGSGAPAGQAIPPSDHVRVARICRFARRPLGLLVQHTLAGDAPLVVEAMRARRTQEGSWEAEGPAEQATLQGPEQVQKILWQAGEEPAAKAASKPAASPPARALRSSAGLWSLAALLLLAGRLLVSQARRGAVLRVAFNEEKKVR